MTNEDALYWCEKFTDNVVISNLKGERMFLALEAMKQCKEALAARISKKAKISINGTTDWNTRCRCPVCNKDLTKYMRCVVTHWMELPEPPKGELYVQSAD